MTHPEPSSPEAARAHRPSRRKFLVGGGAAALAVGSAALWRWRNSPPPPESVWVGKASDYALDLSSVIQAGLKQLGVHAGEIKKRRILLKPNLVEAHRNAAHINTHPLMVRAAAEAFLKLGAESVTVAEGPGHQSDTIYVLEESGFADALMDDHLPFVDLNYDSLYSVPNKGRVSRMTTLTLPAALRQADWIVSMPKLKTHHWAGVTLSMKNMFGVMPGMVYGWPKNVLHYAGIEASIIDIVATVKPHFAIVDGITGMEGDGPLMGPPRHAGVIIMGRNLPAVDATAARIMGINPKAVEYLAYAGGRLGPIDESAIPQVGEAIAPLRTDFQLLEKIAAHRGLRLA